MRRTTVFADEEDLAVLKSAAERRGVPEAELIREAIHLAAMANRSWAEPFFRRAYDGGQRSAAAVEEAAEEMWAERAESYQRVRDGRR